MGRETARGARGPLEASLGVAISRERSKEVCPSILCKANSAKWTIESASWGIAIQIGGQTDEEQLECWVFQNAGFERRVEDGVEHEGGFSGWRGRGTRWRRLVTGDVIV